MQPTLIRTDWPVCMRMWSVQPSASLMHQQVQSTPFAGLRAQGCCVHTQVSELELNNDMKSVNNLLTFLEKVFNGGSDFKCAALPLHVTHA